MIDSHRIYAPRPIKAHSNIKCLKKTKNFERIKDKGYSRNSFPLSNSSISKLSNSRLLIINKTTKEKTIPIMSKNKLQNNHSETFESFSKQVERDFKSEISESQFRLEIFSILKLKDSTNFGFNLSSYPVAGDSDQEFLNEECVKFSKPPERSKNPFQKNFETESQNCKKIIDSMTVNYTNFFEFYFSEDIIESIKVKNLER